MSKSTFPLSAFGTFIFALITIFSCDKSVSSLDYYYPKKYYPGSGEAIVQGKRISGRFGFAIERNKPYSEQLSIAGVLPINPSKGGGEWLVSFKDIPPEMGVYGLIPINHLI